MSNLTITINLDSLTATQLAALQSVALAGNVGYGLQRRAANDAISEAGRANCGDEYPTEFLRINAILLNLDRGEA